MSYYLENRIETLLKFYFNIVRILAIVEGKKR